MTYSGPLFTRLLVALLVGFLPTSILMAGSPAARDRPQLKELWSRLAVRNPTQAYDAINSLVEWREESVQFLKEKMEPARSSEVGIQRWIQQMDADDFRTRETACRKLAGLGIRAEPALIRALEETTSAEVRSRSGRLLYRVRQPISPDRDLLRTRRAIYVLEQIGSESAKRLLNRLSPPPDETIGPVTGEDKKHVMNLPAPLVDPIDRPDDFSEFDGSACIDHTARVFDVAFHPSGRFVASAGGQCYRGFVRVFEVETRKEWLAFETGPPAVCLAYSPNGKFLATGGGGLYEPQIGSVDLWDAENGERIRTFLGHEGAVFAIAFSPDGRWLATGGLDGTIRLWDVRSGRECHQFLGNHYAVFDLAFSPDGRHIVSCGGSGHSPHQRGELALWEVASGERIDCFRGHKGPALSVAFSPDGQMFASGGGDKSVRVWSLRHRKEIAQLRGHKRPIHGVAFHPMSAQISAADMRGEIKSWDLSEQELIGEFTQARTGRVFRLAFSPDGQSLATAGPDLAINLLKTNQVVPD